MGYTEDQIQKAKDVDLLSLLSPLTELRKVSNSHGGEWHGPCPFCGGTDRFCVWPNEDPPSWWCRSQGGGQGCGKGGDAIRLVMEKHNVRFPDAVAMLIGERAVPEFHTPPKRPEIDRRILEKKKVTPAMTTALGYASRVYHLALVGGKESKVARDYLKKRGFDRKAILRFRIGYAAPGVLLTTMLAIPGGGKSMARVLEQYEDAGLVGKTDDGKSFERMAGRVVFPNFNFRHGVVQMIGRSLKPIEPPIRWKALAGLNKELYPVGMCRPEGLLILTESVVDVVNIWQLEFQAASPWGKDLKDEMVNRLMRYPSIAILPQNDIPGKESAAKWKEKMPHARMLEIPYEEGQKDFNDIWREKGKEQANQILREAMRRAKIEIREEKSIEKAEEG